MLKNILAIIVIALCLVFAAILGTYWGTNGLTAEELTYSNMSCGIYDMNGNRIAQIFGEKKISNVKIENLSEGTKKAFVAIEDKDFYTHSGIDWSRTAGAMLNLATPGTNYGASTITQQLVKNIRGRTYWGAFNGSFQFINMFFTKIEEISISKDLEENMSKDKILEQYLNRIYYGDRIFGLDNFSEYLFGVEASKIDKWQASIAAAIINNPEGLYDPKNNKEAYNISFIILQSLWINCNTLFFSICTYAFTQPQYAWIVFWCYRCIYI